MIEFAIYGCGEPSLLFRWPACIIQTPTQRVHVCAAREFTAAGSFITFFIINHVEFHVTKPWSSRLHFEEVTGRLSGKPNELYMIFLMCWLTYSGNYLEGFKFQPGFMLWIFGIALFCVLYAS